MRHWAHKALLITALVLSGCSGEVSSGTDAEALTSHDSVDVTEQDNGDAGVCGTPTGPAPQGPTPPALVTEEDPPTGSVTGRLVHPDGQPIEAMRMLACTPSICYWDETDSDGRFMVSDLTLEPLKMQTGDPGGTHLDLIFYHLLESEGVSELPREVIVPLRDEALAVAWADEGGTVTLANGQLELEVEPGAVAYPVGTKDKAVSAMRLEGDDLPPFDWAPWEGREDETFAFVVNPVGVTVSPHARVRVLGTDPGPCTAFRLWVVHAKTGALTYAGLMTTETRDGEPLLVSSVDAEIDEFTTLILSPLED